MKTTQRNVAVLIVLWIAAMSPVAQAADGGLHLSGRALVAVPQANHGVFLTWRYLEQDGPDTGFAVYRASGESESYAKIGEARETTTFVDAPGQGGFSYYVMPDSGELKSERSNVCRVTTQARVAIGSKSCRWPVAEDCSSPTGTSRIRTATAS